jgi:GT2 family glycosyltransferase
MRKITDQGHARVIIVNWNGKHFLGECLSALERQSYPNFDVTLVDNGSTDGSVDFVHDHFPRVHVVSLHENVGFAKANNIAMIRALSDGAQYIALLNNDTKVDEKWLEHLARIMASEKDIGICASKMLRMEAPHILDSTGHIFKKGRISERGHGEVEAHQYDDRLSLVGACAGACLYRKEMLEDIGLFEESYGSYYEDAELSWRAYNRGWRARFVPESTVLHYRGGTTMSAPQIEKEMQIRCAMNTAETVRRHATLGQKLVVSLTCMMIILVPFRDVQKRLDRNDMGRRLHWEQLRRLWFRKAQII